MASITHTAPLYTLVAADGVAAHWDAVAPVAAAAELRGAPTGVLAALRDHTLSPVMRLRAFGRATVYAARPLPTDQPITQHDHTDLAA